MVMKNQATVTTESAGETDCWEGLLGKCIDSIDSDEFHGNLVEALRTLVDIDYSVVLPTATRTNPSAWTTPILPSSG